MVRLTCTRYESYRVKVVSMDVLAVLKCGLALAMCQACNSCTAERHTGAFSIGRLFTCSSFLVLYRQCGPTWLFSAVRGTRYKFSRPRTLALIV